MPRKKIRLSQLTEPMPPEETCVFCNHGEAMHYVSRVLLTDDGPKGQPIRRWAYRMVKLSCQKCGALRSRGAGSEQVPTCHQFPAVPAFPLYAPTDSPAAVEEVLQWIAERKGAARED